MESKEELLRKELKKFKKVSGIIGCAVVRRDGLMVMAEFPGNINSRSIAAMSAAMVGTSETASKELKIGNMEEVVIETNRGRLISTGAGPDAIFVSITKKSAKPGSVVREMKKVAKSISKLVR